MNPGTDRDMQRFLNQHQLSIALVHPQIAPNTGNIGRLCTATGTALHLVRPMGFVLSDKNLQRSGMDYWDRLQLTVHDDLPAFEGTMSPRRLWLFSSKATRSFWEVEYAPEDCLVFGSETAGLPDAFVRAHDARLVRIPQAEGERCLNLATSAGIALYEALRQIRHRVPAHRST